MAYQKTINFDTSGRKQLEDIDHSQLKNLGSDDHAQYHNDARALIWLALQSILILADTPSSFSGQKRAVLRVDGDEAALAFEQAVESLWRLATGKIQHVQSGGQLITFDEFRAEGTSEVMVDGDGEQFIGNCGVYESISNPAIHSKKISSGFTVTVSDDEQYLVEGMLNIQGTLILDGTGELVCL